MGANGHLSEPRRARRLSSCLRLCCLILAAPTSGCVGYVMGWSDAEVDRLRRIVAELEAKNASLAEELIEMQALLEKPRLDEEGGRGPKTDLPPSAASEAVGREKRPARARPLLPGPGDGVPIPTESSACQN